ncbi:hypothetical protein MUK70_21460 [Dyadobacter chenwenxiniae]|uniref:Uncharacterized protein n=1 Tax=Dyadobacter chenwenxiniae TaxID=2906456 RepID=A0A9X1TDD1_9BACT|nr:hypothetical protein [Dyadobacter chenwenxiniae]MCF0061811.1 hypothetical protein [Dyadobacter chenwenxiniae]UON81627.1 hypothetical protein MUK70_21460 [Dyadobacter chenwenxiniae]
MARKIRKDITVGGLEKKLKLAPGSIVNPDGRDARSDKKLETLQNDAAKALKKIAAKKTAAKTPEAKAGVKKNAVQPKTIKPVTADQKTAALRKVKSSPKATSSMVKKVQAAIKKTGK